MEMQDSGIEWIGEIAADTMVIRLKHYSYMKGRIGWQGLKSDDFIDEGPLCVTGTDFENGKVNWNTCYHVSEKRYAMDSNIHIKVGDLLVTKDGTIGKLAIIDELPDRACLNSHLLIIRPLQNKYINRFLYYIMLSPIFSSYYQLASTGTTMDSLSQEKMGNFSFPIFDINKQSKIVDYLDEKCSEIDSLIADIQKQIETLELYKKSVITEAVTQGLNPDVEMKDSGIEWIGHIPKHWGVSRLKYELSCPMKYGASQSGVEYSDDLPRYIRITDITSDNKLKEDGKLSLTNEQARGYILNSDTVLFARSGGTVGKTFLFTQDYGKAAFAGYLISAVPNADRIVAKWLYYYSLSSVYWDWANRIFTQATIQNIGADKYNNMPITITAVSEQEKIIKYLDQKCADINTIIELKKQQLDTLVHHEKSLIYEYVTGKKEVV